MRRLEQLWLANEKLRMQRQPKLRGVSKALGRLQIAKRQRQKAGMQLTGRARTSLRVPVASSGG